MFHICWCHAGQQIYAWIWPLSKTRLSRRNGYLSLRLQFWMPKSVWKIANTWEVWWVTTVAENLLIFHCIPCMLFERERVRFWVGLGWNEDSYVLNIHFISWFLIWNSTLTRVLMSFKQNLKMSAEVCLLCIVLMSL
jgi:hypothetical protein